MEVSNGEVALITQEPPRLCRFCATNGGPNSGQPHQWSPPPEPDTTQPKTPEGNKNKDWESDLPNRPKETKKRKSAKEPEPDNPKKMAKKAAKDNRGEEPKTNEAEGRTSA